MRNPVTSVDGYTKGMAAIGGSVSVSSTLAPRLFFRVFGLPTEQATPGAVLGWRLMAARTAAISALAARGNATARDLFLPVQVLDKAAWWWAYSRGELPRRTTLMAAAASGAIIGLDVLRRANQTELR
ncbi:hypothetical protein [Paraconexibacter algicola]|nr:hypothetical protein [Paraconexibacter algicola]